MEFVTALCLTTAKTLREETDAPRHGSPPSWPDVLEAKACKACVNRGASERRVGEGGDGGEPA